ncbi:MAG: HD domain-containing protein [archaeon]
MQYDRGATKFWGFIKDPIYGYIRLSETEKNILDAAPVQRLRRIKQLSGAEFVYPAANHTRFEHALGAMYLAGTLGQSLPIELEAYDILCLRTAALLHDVGHTPFSHLFEPMMTALLEKTHEDLGSWIIEKSELSDVLQKEGLDSKRISKLAVGKLEEPKRAFMDQVIRSSVDVDKMDFVMRDSYHTGAGYGYVDVFRLIYTMDVLDGNLAVNATAVPTLETFLLARLQSFRTIYFHRTSRAVQIMVLKALEKAEPELNLLGFKTPEEYLELDDYSVWAKLKQCTKSKQLIEDVEKRRLLKCCYDKTFYTKDELVSSIFADDAVRRHMEEEIAVKAKVSQEEVWIDVPSLPSVPYHNAMQFEPMDIPVFQEARGGEKISVRLTELSQIVEALRVFMNIIRVYSTAKHRENVMKAAEDVLGKQTISTRVSY